MTAIIVPYAVFALVFGAICVAYALGRGNKEIPSWFRNLTRIRRYSPLIEVYIEYRDARGRKMLPKVSIQRSLSGRSGRLYLFGFCNEYPRTFRVDRILSIANLDGEIIDTRRFLIERLAIPPDLCMAQARSFKPLPPAS